MLMLTQDAAQVIGELADQPQLGSLRISTGPAAQDGAAPGLQIQLAEEPGPEDAVVEAEEGRVFLAPEAVPTLEDKVLDAHVEDDGIRFTIMEIAEEPGDD